MADVYETKTTYGNEFDLGESLPFDTLKFQLDYLMKVCAFLLL